MRWYNPIMIGLLRSPLHGLLSGTTLLVSVTGRKSGRVYNVPVNYAGDGDQLIIVSFQERTWWRNLRGGAAVEVRVQGRNLAGQATAITDAHGVAEGLRDFFRVQPSFAKYYGVTLDAEGHPENDARIAELAGERVVVRVRLN